MTSVSAKPRLRPSLLDRLTDHHPERQVESGQERSVDEATLRELVRRDLTWLFNTTQLSAGSDLSRYPEVERSVVNFGIPDLTGHTLSSIQVDKLELRVVEALWHYEPRLLRDSIKVRVRTGSNRFGTAALIFDIEADLFAEPSPLPLRLRTEVDIESGRVAVDDVRAQGDE